MRDDEQGLVNEREHGELRETVRYATLDHVRVLDDGAPHADIHGIRRG
jgi:hypothetical protein